MGDEFWLPEPIIQVIQSFLSSRNSAKTTILSKARRSAWLTRPNLDFDQTQIEPRFDSHSIFSEFAEKTLKRYEDLSLKIESFKLCLKDDYLYYKHNPNPLIVKALELGAARLTLRLRATRLISKYSFLPDEVFRALTLEFCQIMNRDVIAWTMLQSLSLTDVEIESTDMIFLILSSCPSIRALWLCRVWSFSLPRHDDTTIHDHGLRSLVLDDVYYYTLFLGDDLSSKFPSLKELTLREYSRGKAPDLNISSPSLERVNFMNGDIKSGPRVKDYVKHGSRVKFDVPSICKFTFQGQIRPKLSIRSNSRGSWESHVSISRRKCLSASWFCRLSKFLTKFRHSRISLSFHVLSQTSFDYEAGEIQGLPRLDIENLNSTMSICHL